MNIWDTYIEWSNSASRVSRNKLDLHLNRSKQKLILRLDSGTFIKTTHNLINRFCATEARLFPNRSMHVFVREKDMELFCRNSHLQLIFPNVCVCVRERALLQNYLLLQLCTYTNLISICRIVPQQIGAVCIVCVKKRWSFVAEVFISNSNCMNFSPINR